jgi:peptide/nickel transport system permease protein
VGSHSVKTYIVQRLLAVIPVLLGVSMVIFLTMKLIPGDIARTLLGPIATEETVSQLRRALGLDQPVYVQYVKWLGRTLRGDLGMSPVVNRPVVAILLPKIWNTLILVGCSFLLAVVVGVMVGVRAAAREYSVFDRLSMSLALGLGNMPPFWLGLVLISLFALRLRWFPMLGMRSLRGESGFLDLLHHLVLPMLTTAAAPMAIIARMTRASVLEILREEFIKAAWAKGLSSTRVIYGHALAVAWPPIVTIAALQIGYLLTGAVFTEWIFGWPGLGQQLVQSVIARDIAVVQGAVLFIASVFVLVNLAADILNLTLDPRTRPV